MRPTGRHVWRLGCYQLDRSVGVEHCIELGHQFIFQSIKVLSNHWVMWINLLTS